MKAIYGLNHFRIFFLHKNTGQLLKFEILSENVFYS